jgi:hypothetical protein
VSHRRILVQLLERHAALASLQALWRMGFVEFPPRPPDRIAVLFVMELYSVRREIEGLCAHHVELREIDLGVHLHSGKASRMRPPALAQTDGVA